jgi:adhesin transport system membrane fusion protein
MLRARAERLNSEAGGSASSCANNAACFEEQRLSAVRRDAARSKQAGLAAAVEQRRRDLGEAQATANSLESSVALARSQVQILEPQVARKIIPQTELMAAQRELVDTQGRLSAARQAAARAAASVSEAQAELSGARFDFQQQALSERSDAMTKLAINEQTRKGASEIVGQNAVRTPVAGIVNDLKVNTVGGVVAPGEKLMQIVPTGDRLLVEARIKPKDIAFIKLGDPAVVKVTAYDFSIYGGIRGTVAEISPDSLYDENTREAYYIVQVRTDRSYIESGGRRLSIIPGMICDVEVLTGRKSILTYLLKPIAKAFGEAMTER